MPGHQCGTCFLVSSTSQALSNRACLWFQDWGWVFMLVYEVLGALSQTGSLGFSKIIKTNQDYGNKPTETNKKPSQKQNQPKKTTTTHTTLVSLLCRYKSWDMKLLSLSSLCFLSKFQSRFILARTLGLSSKLVPGLDFIFFFMSWINDVELFIFYWFSSVSSCVLGMSSAKSLVFANTFRLFVRTCFCVYLLWLWWSQYTWKTWFIGRNNIFSSPNYYEAWKKAGSLSGIWHLKKKQLRNSLWVNLKTEGVCCLFGLLHNFLICLTLILIMLCWSS